MVIALKRSSVASSMLGVSIRPVVFQCTAANRVDDNHKDDDASIDDGQSPPFFLDVIKECCLA